MRACVRVVTYVGQRLCVFRPVLELWGGGAYVVRRGAGAGAGEGGCRKVGYVVVFFSWWWWRWLSWLMLMKGGGGSGGGGGGGGE